MGKEKDNLEMVASEAAPRRRTKNTARNSKKTKGNDSLQLEPASVPGPTATITTNTKQKAKAAAPQFAPATDDTATPSTPHDRRGSMPTVTRYKAKDQTLQLAPATYTTSESSVTQHRRFVVDEEAVLTTRSEAFEAYVPGQREVEKQSRRREQDHGSPTLLEGDNVKVEADILARRRCRLYLFWAMFFILIALVIGLSVGVTQSITSTTANLEERTDSPSRVPSTIPSVSPTVSPSSTPTSANFETVVKHLSREDFGPSIIAALQDPNSPQSRAARWLVDEDEIFTFPLNETDPESQLRRRFRQRYALATFYFATGGETSWKNQGTFLSPTENECGWGDAGFGNLQVNCRTECSLFVIMGLNESCDELLPVVAGLTMYQLNLVGHVPPEIGALTLLTGLDLTGNELTGSLPSEIYNLRYLYVMSVAFNQITGSLSETGMKALTNLASPIIK